MNARIVGTGWKLPVFQADNEYLSKLVDTSDEWITERTGIRSRHLARDETTASLAEAAALDALERAGLAASELELLIVATITSDTDTPSTACRVQAGLGASKAVAFDINAACSGFLYALHIAGSFIQSGVYKNALLVGAETLSRLVDWKDRSTCILFGDGAGAAVLKASPEGGILSQTVGSNGAKWNTLSCMGRPNQNPLHPGKADFGYLTMDGREIFSFAVKTVPVCVEETLEKAGVSKEEVKFFLLHQANQRIIQSVARRLAQPEEKFPMNLEQCGNTSAASLPILMAQLDRQGSLKRGDNLILSGFGAGLTWGACLIEW